VLEEYVKVPLDKAKELDKKALKRNKAQKKAMDGIFEDDE